MITKTSRMNEKRWPNGRGERGALTVFTAVLVLILMTLLLVYATRVSLFETRVSANEVRQKQAFNVAEAVVDQGVMYLLANTDRILSNRAGAFSNGTGFTEDGWLAAGNLRWGICTATEIALATHPCGGDVPAPVGSYFYDDPNTAGIDTMPLNELGFPTGSTARLSALMCFVNVDTAGAGVCESAPATADDEPGAALVLTLLAYGYSDCTDTTIPIDVTTCSGRATVAKPVSAYKELAGSPSVPLVTKSTFPPQGTAEVVGNPNAGGVGVPLTVWANNNPACSPGSPILSSGSWQTCEMEEWYHTNEQPEGVACTDNNCFCGPGGNDTDYFLSWQTANDSHIGIDIVVDPVFPCDLFETFFGIPRNLYQIIKDSAQVLPDCSSLGPQSSGLIWISGSNCTLNANTVVGSPTAPVILVSAATDTKLNGGVEIFGILYVFDGEDINANIETLGGATVYGAAVMDATMSKFQGNFQVVYNDDVIASANGIGGLGSVNGGWRDFGLPEITW